MRHRPFSLPAALLAVLAMTAGPALAHHLPPGMEDVDEFADSVAFLAGFSHPVTGLDHLLAALLTGAVAARLGKPGRAGMLLGGAFLFAAGSFAPNAGLILPGGTVIILCTILLAASGAIIPSLEKLPIMGGALVLLQAWQGWAHAGESVGSRMVFAVGLASATLLLMIAGMALSILCRPRNSFPEPNARTA